MIPSILFKHTRLELMSCFSHISVSCLAHGMCSLAFVKWMNKWKIWHLLLLLTHFLFPVERSCCFSEYTHFSSDSCSCSLYFKTSCWEIPISYVTRLIWLLKSFLTLVCYSKFPAFWFMIASLKSEQNIQTLLRIYIFFSSPSAHQIETIIRIFFKGSWMGISNYHLTYLEINRMEKAV